MRTTVSNLRRMIRGLIRESGPNFNPSNKDVEDSIFEMCCEAIDEVLQMIGYEKVPHKELMRAHQESSYPQCWQMGRFIVSDMVELALENRITPTNPLREDQYQLTSRLFDRLEEEYAEFHSGYPFEGKGLFGIAQEMSTDF